MKRCIPADALSVCGGRYQYNGTGRSVDRGWASGHRCSSNAPDHAAVRILDDERYRRLRGLLQVVVDGNAVGRIGSRGLFDRPRHVGARVPADAPARGGDEQRVLVARRRAHLPERRDVIQDPEPPACVAATRSSSLTMMSRTDETGMFCRNACQRMPSSNDT